MVTHTKSQVLALYQNFPPQKIEYSQRPHFGHLNNINHPPLLKMKYIFSEEQLVIPEDVKIHIRSRIVTVEGPRGTIPAMSPDFPRLGFAGMLSEQDKTNIRS